MGFILTPLRGRCYPFLAVKGDTRNQLLTALYLISPLHSPKFVIVIRMFRQCLLAALVCIFVFCAVGGSANDKNKDSSKAAGHSSQSRPIHLDRAGRMWADKTLRKMSNEEKVGQLFMIWVKVQFMNDADPIWVELLDKVRKYHIGSLGMTVPTDGPLLLKSQPYEAAELLNRLQKTSKLPLIFAADLETIPGEIPYLFAGQDRIAGVGQAVEAEPGDGAVFSDQRRHVGDRADGRNFE